MKINENNCCNSETIGYDERMTNTEQVTAAQVKEMNAKGVIVFPYPRKGMISINGGQSKPATKSALAEARKYLDANKITA